jgi:hypothetical protein
VLLIGKTSKGKRLGQLYSTTAIAIALSFASVPAFAQTWDGGGADANWSTANNWSANAVPAAGGAVSINGAGGANANSTVNVNSANLASVGISASTVTVAATLT